MFNKKKIENNLKIHLQWCIYQVSKNAKQGFRWKQVMTKECKKKQNVCKWHSMCKQFNTRNILAKHCMWQENLFNKRSKKCTFKRYLQRQVEPQFPHPLSRTSLYEKISLHFLFAHHHDLHQWMSNSRKTQRKEFMKRPLILHK